MDIGDKIHWLTLHGTLSVDPKAGQRRYSWVRWHPRYSILVWDINADTVDEAILELWDAVTDNLFALCNT